MNKASEPILELLDESGIALSPSTIVVNLNIELDNSPARSTIYKAFDPLLENGFIEKADVDGTYYRITPLGREYLRGELDRSEFEQ